MSTNDTTGTGIDAERPATEPKREQKPKRGPKPKRRAAFTPFASMRTAAIAFAHAHPQLVAALAAPAAAGMALLLLWFIVFSGFDAPATFIYAAF